MWFSPFHRLKSLAHKVACPGVIDCFNAHQLIFIEPLPRAPLPHPPTRTAASMARPHEPELCPKTLKICGCCQHQTPESSVSAVANGAGRGCRPPLFQAGRPNTPAFPSGACQIMCDAQCLCCSPTGKTQPSGSLRSESTPLLQPRVA